MSQRRTRSSQIVEMDEAWRKHWEQAVREVEAEKPELEILHQQIVAAKAEPTLSGQLRRAAHKDGRSFPEMVKELGISSEDYNEFLAGQRALPSDVMDRLAQAVGYELVQVGKVIKRRTRISRVVEMDEAWRKRWEEDVRYFESERGRAEVEELGQKLAAAQREPTLSGQLRRAAHQNWRDPDEMVKELGISREEYSDWLAGEGTLTSDVMDRLAALVGCELVVVKQVEQVEN